MVDYDCLKNFDCTSFSLMSTQKIIYLDSIFKNGTFLGCANDVKDYEL